MKQVSCGKQRDAKNSTKEVEIVAGAMLESPMHPREQAKRFANMSKDDYNQASGTDYL